MVDIDQRSLLQSLLVAGSQAGPANDETNAGDSKGR